LNKKVLLVVLGIVLLISISALLYFNLFHKVEPVYFQLINDEQKLDNDVLKWIKSNEQNKGIHAYALDNVNPYEMLLYYNQNVGKNNYTVSELNAKTINGVLKINIDDKPATNDSFVNDKITAHFIIKSKPKDIEVYHNKEKVAVDYTKGIVKSIVK
jgi:hypothetical protein